MRSSCKEAEWRLSTDKMSPLSIRMGEPWMGGLVGVWKCSGGTTLENSKELTGS